MTFIDVPDGEEEKKKESYINEIEDNKWPVDVIGLTGGEPFLNPSIIEILEVILRAGHKALILTNAYNVISRWERKLLKLNNLFIAPRNLKEPVICIDSNFKNTF